MIFILIADGSSFELIECRVLLIKKRRKIHQTRPFPPPPKKKEIYNMKTIWKEFLNFLWMYLGIKVLPIVLNMLKALKVKIKVFKAI